MDGTIGTLGHATSAVDIAAAVVASLRSQEASLPKGEDLAALQGVIHDLERRRSRLAKQCAALSHAPVAELAERWRAFRFSYEDFLGRESRRRLEAMEAKRRGDKQQVAEETA